MNFSKIRHCEFCGVEVPETSFDYLGNSLRRVFCCSEASCDEAFRELEREDLENRRERAEEDDYSRY